LKDCFPDNKYRHTIIDSDECGTTDIEKIRTFLHPLSPKKIKRAGGKTVMLPPPNRNTYNVFYTTFVSACDVIAKIMT
jgi:hypothetical protein